MFHNKTPLFSNFGKTGLCKLKKVSLQDIQENLVCQDSLGITKQGFLVADT